MACITKDEYKTAKGIDLDLELKGNDDDSNKVRRFLDEWEGFCLDYLKIHYAMNDSVESMAPYQLGRFKKGLIEQISYVIDNGDLANDSGYNPQTGLVADLSRISMSPRAVDQFRLGGMCNVSRDAPSPAYGGSISGSDEDLESVGD
jgi:hypothetical protein